MRIIIAIKNLSSVAGGAERVACTLASGLANNGHKITIITFDKLSSSSFYPLDNKVEKINLSIGNASSRSTILEFILRLRALNLLVKKNKPDIVIGFMHSMYIPLAFSLIGLKVPIIASEHTVISHYKKKPIQYILLLISSIFINSFTVLSHSIKSEYPKIISKKMKIISNPISVLNSEKPKLNDKSRKILLNIGRLDPEKDHITLINSFYLISKSYPEWDLHIVGNGSLKNKINNLIIYLNLTNRIFINEITKDIGSFYENADIFVNSSRYEAFGLATAEAMAHGLPCIGFEDCSGTNILIEHNKTGLLVKGNGDRSYSLAEGLKILFADINIRNKMGRNGTRSIASNFSEAKILQCWEKLLYDMVKLK